MLHFCYRVKQLNAEVGSLFRFLTLLALRANAPLE
jgi:hypothetical protein